MKSLVIAAALLIPQLLHAQSGRSKRLAWGDVEVLVFADTIHGLRVNAGTTEQYDASNFRAFGAVFDPDSVKSWIPAARTLIEERGRPTPADSFLVSPPLVGIEGDTVRLFRRAQGDHWESGAVLRFIGAEGHPGFGLAVQPREAKEFVRVLQAQAAESRFQPALVLQEMAAAEEGWDVAPKMIGRLENRHFGQRGRAVIEFIVGTDGKVDPASIKIVSTDAEMFGGAARTALLGSRWTPATAHGVPVAAGVRFTMTFE